MNRGGFANIVVIVSLIFAGLLLSLIGLSSSLLGEKQAVMRGAALQSLELTMANIRSVLENQQNLEIIVNLSVNNGIRCTKDDTCTYSPAFHPLMVVDLNKNTLTKGREFGIDLRGNSCELAVANCYFIIFASWRAACPMDGSPCTNPPVEFQVEAAFAPSTPEFPLNLNNYVVRITAPNVAALVH